MSIYCVQRCGLVDIYSGNYDISKLKRMRKYVLVTTCKNTAYDKADKILAHV